MTHPGEDLPRESRAVPVVRAAVRDLSARELPRPGPALPTRSVTGSDVSFLSGFMWRECGVEWIREQEGPRHGPGSRWAREIRRSYR